MLREEAERLDAEDPLQCYRDEFLLPKHNDKDCIYLCGNSLGLQPKSLRSHVNDQLDKWAAQAVEGHFSSPTPWLTIDDTVLDSMARVVGAKSSEVVMMNSLTCNLHLMMAAFYKPTSSRFRILIEKKAFPSDVHAVTSQISFHGFDPHQALIEVGPLEGETCLRIEHVEETIREAGDSLSLVLFSGIQYFTGQLFDMNRIVLAARSVGARVGFDLAHAVGNVPLELHQWGCDFACWCSYKYLNCGPGSIGGCFIHERNFISDPSNSSLHTLHGWWGHQLKDRFEMLPDFVPCEGAYAYRLSNPPVLLIACVRASLDIFDRVMNPDYF